MDIASLKKRIWLQGPKGVEIKSFGGNLDLTGCQTIAFNAEKVLTFLLRPITYIL